MTSLRLRRSLRRDSDDGVAMIFVIAIGLVVTALAVAMFANVLANQNNSRYHRNITSAQAAAEAGLDDTIFQLGQFNANGTSKWTTLQASCTQTTPCKQSFATGSYSVWMTPQSGTSNLVVYSRGSYGVGPSTSTRTIRALVSKGSPPAFDFSMFASKGIDIHHHGSAYLSPQVWTTALHSNGYINLDYSSEFYVNSMEAVGTITMQKGGGSYAGGSIPTTGYNWYDPLNQKCYPGGMASPGGIGQVGGSCPYNYSGQAMVAGTIKAGSITIGSRGEVMPVTSALTLDTGQVIDASGGDIYAGSATVGGTTYSSAGNPVSCSACNKGTSVQPGQVSGKLYITPGYTPDTIPFPSLNYATYRTQAQGEQTATFTHVFSSGGQFLSYVTGLAGGPANTGFYQNIASNGTLSAWQPGDPAPGAILLDGDFDITSGSLTLNYSTIKGLANAATGTNGPAPVIIIRGSLVVETGGVTLNSGLVMVGLNNRLDFLQPATSTTPVIVDTTKLLDPNATMPAVLAAGGSISASDYDTDSPWSSPSIYEPAKATPIYIRGLVYSAAWNASTNSSTPEPQHFHNYDPKNLTKIYGAQVGSQLHDCNNFSFSYDPLVKNALGFGGGAPTILDYEELGQ